MSNMINSGVLKLVLAISILVGLVGLVFYAHTQAEKEMKAFEKKQETDPMSDTITIDNYELKEVSDDNELRWKLTAGTGILEPTTKDVKLTDISVNYFKDGEISMRLTAPLGDANEISRIIKLRADEKTKVVAQGDEKAARLETENLELTKKNQFIATGGVNIVWPGVAKVTGDTAEGMMTDAILDRMLIKGNTHAIIDI